MEAKGGRAAGIPPTTASPSAKGAVGVGIPTTRVLAVYMVGCALSCHMACVPSLTPTNLRLVKQMCR